MKIFFSKKKLINKIKNTTNLGFVPTMGAIHKGHISLIKKSNKLSNKTIVTIFVNKPQFNRENDFIKYPRTLRKDINLLKKNGTDFLYLPSVKQIYQHGPNKKIKISTLKKILCGKNRPGHFEAVVDVIDRFIKIINPSRIFLGEKDFQQLIIIKEFIHTNKIKTKIVMCPTIREKNGMACSSRNYLLSHKQKMIASNVYKFVVNNKQDLIKKKINLSKFKQSLKLIGISKLDYLEIFDMGQLLNKKNIKKKSKIFIAYYLGNIRLIDNF